MSANAGPVEAENPTSSARAGAGKPISTPTASVTTATAKAGNQPECIAARPMMSSCSRAANAA